jgi:lysozyme
MTIRRVSSRGHALIKGRESFRPRRYYCPAGVLSIGYGHAIKPHEEFPEPMTEQEATDLLADDLAPIEIYLTAVFPKVTQGQFDALASFAYNVGLGALDRSTLKRHLQAGDVMGAANEFGKWIYANKVVLRGLVARRAEERALFLEEVDGKH